MAQVLPLPKLKELFSGAAPLGGELAAAAMARLNVPVIRQGRAQSHTRTGNRPTRGALLIARVRAGRLTVRVWCPSQVRHY